MISQDIIIDEDFNLLSINSQNIFIRMLAVSDDYGVVPSSLYTLDKLINTPKKINLLQCLHEIVEAKLGQPFSFEGKEFFYFKKERFDDYQSYVIAKRTKSEYLRKPKDFMESNAFQEILGNSPQLLSTSIESNKQKVESKEIGASEKTKTPDTKARALSLQEVQTYCRELGLPNADAEYLWYKWEANGWLNGKSPIKDWKATIRSWKAAGYMPSQKNGSHPPAPIARPANYVKTVTPDVKPFSPEMKKELQELNEKFRIPDPARDKKEANDRAFRERKES